MWLTAAKDVVVEAAVEFWIEDDFKKMNNVG